MAQFLKPDNLNNVWASGGDRIYPGDTKYATGWQVEIPPRQYFNQIDYKQDQMLAHLNQHGISVWDAETEYQAWKSYVQGSDGQIYRAVTTNTNTNPVGDLTGAWELPFLTPEQATAVSTAEQSRAMVLDDVYISPLQLANAFTGTNSQRQTNGFQKLPGGLIIQWGYNTTPISTEGVLPPQTFPRPFQTACFIVIALGRNLTSLTTKDLTLSLVSRSTTQFQLYANSVTGGTQSLDGYDWIALGV